ncbi:hypothetical protein [Oceanithermus sp.]|uniref:hypothetical protein n=1 Tax=Oceanithermus sp. TaxID=2268145 RepID=UPI0025DFD454|nr:hypothetical protein [Oceanithermus sp.]
MNVLPKGAEPPRLQLTALDGRTLDLGALEGPLVLAFVHPEVAASRNVVGFLRKLHDMLPDLPIWFVTSVDREATERYVKGYLGNYLEGYPVVAEGCDVLAAFGATHVPTVHYFEGGKVDLAFSGFHKLSLNTLAERAAAALEAKAKPLITDLENKGEYELAEPSGC